MSNEAARGIDPRFDPRFQRGYTTDAAAAARAAERRKPHDPPTEEEAALFGPRPPGTAPERPAPRVEPAPAPEPDHAAALLAYFGPEAHSVAHPEASQYARSEAPALDQHRIGPPPTAFGEHSDPGMPSSQGDVDHFVVEPEPESESPFVRHPSLRYWLALAVSIGFAVAGAAIYWNVALQQMSGVAMLDTAGQAFQNALSSLGTGLVQSGLLGVVVVLAVWAVQSARKRTP